MPRVIAATVLQGGRPDLAGTTLADVVAPTLFVVGGNDYQAIELNQGAQRMLRCSNRLEITPGASPRFEEPGTLDEVADLAAEWFCARFETVDLTTRSGYARI